MTGAVYVNGRLTSESEAVISVLDHGFLYGEGVYEVCRSYGGHIRLLGRHLTRLRASAELIALPVPWDDETLESRVRATLEHGGLRPWTAGTPDAYIRLLLTRGVGELSYDPRLCPAPSMVIIARPHALPPDAIYADGVAVAIVGVERNRRQALNPRIKSNNLLNNSLAMEEALGRGAFEAVMRNADGHLAECSQSNLFVVRGGRVLTPPVSEGLLPGITRALVLELCAALDIPCAEAVLNDEDLFGADEAFLTSTTREVVPIVAVDQHRIGTGRPGAVVRQLLEAYRARVRSAL